jgi:hypothetical protein
MAKPRSLHEEFDALPDLNSEFDALPGAAAEAPAPAPQAEGVPDLGILNALRTQFGNGLAKGGFDEGVGAAFSRKFDGGRMDLRMPDGTVRPAFSQGDLYRAGRDFLRQEQESAQKYHPWLGGAAQMGGELLSDYALAGPKAVGRGYQTLAGLARGFLGSNTDLTPDKITAGDAGYATLSTLANALIGNQAPVVAGKLANAAPVKYLGNKVGAGLEYAGNKVQDLAGWLKVNSLHPTPLLGEAMEGIPGGIPAAGRELLDRGIGGLTKGGTAKQIESAFQGATTKANTLAKAYDARGVPVDLADALSVGQEKAAELIDRPATAESGRKLQSLVSDYAEKYGAGEAAPTTAQEALTAKRDLGDIGYGATHEFKLNKNPVTGNYGKGVRQFEREINATLENALGPEFGQANTVVRQLGGAKQAAERGAAKTAGNNLIGLLPYIAGVAGAAGGHMSGHAAPEVVAYGLASLLSSKYGAQAGAQTVYRLGQLLKLSPQLLELAGEGYGLAPAAQRAASRGGEYLSDLLRARPQPLPSFAAGDKR